MNAFFHMLSTRHPVEVVFEYAKYLHQADVKGLLIKKRADPESTYYVGLSCRPRDFASITKRASLISNTLLLSHETVGEYREVQQISDSSDSSNRIDSISVYPGNDNLRTSTAIGVQCPDLAAVGDWVLESEKLLRAGLAWYLPSYVEARGTLRAGTSYTPDQTLRRLSPGPDPVDYLVRDRHAIDASGADPTKGKFVRPILRINLPFLDGVSLQDFSSITVNEFDSYRELRNYLRTVFHQLDDAMGAVQLERELVRIGLEMEGEILQAASGMRKARKRVPSIP